MHPLFEHAQELTEEEKEFSRVVKEYYKKFNDRFPTQSSGLNIRNQMELMKYCISVGKTYEEVTGDVYDGVSKQ